MANKKKKFLPDNIIELMFGLGASIVIIGALLKITHADLIPGYVTGNTMLTIGLIVEAVIFAISGIQGYMVGDSSIEDKGLQTIEAETQSLQQAVDQTRHLKNRYFICLLEHHPSLNLEIRKKFSSD